jgi:hypothetical protein
MISCFPAVHCSSQPKLLQVQTSLLTSAMYGLGTFAGWSVAYNAALGNGCSLFTGLLYSSGTNCATNARYAIVRLQCAASFTFAAVPGMSDGNPCALGYQFTLGLPEACVANNLVAPGSENCIPTPSVTPPQTGTPAGTGSPTSAATSTPSPSPSCPLVPVLSVAPAITAGPAASGVLIATIPPGGGSNTAGGFRAASACGTSSQELPTSVGQYVVSYPLPAVQGTLFLDTCGGADPAVDTVLAVGSCTGASPFACVANNDDSAGCGNGLQSRLAVTLDGSLTSSVIIVVTAYSSTSVGSGAFTLNYTFAVGVCGSGAAVSACASTSPSAYALGSTHTASPSATGTPTRASSASRAATPAPTLTQAATPATTPSATAVPCANVPGLAVLQLPPLVLALAATGYITGSTSGSGGSPNLWGGACSSTDGTAVPTGGTQAVFVLLAPALSGTLAFSTCSGATTFDTMVRATCYYSTTYCHCFSWLHNLTFATCAVVRGQRVSQLYRLVCLHGR